MIDIFLDHLLISLVPWLAGMVVGGGLGYACALVARSLFSTLPGLRRASMLLPWRTVAVTLALVALVSPIIVVRVGLGRVAGMISVGIFVFVFALPFTIGTLLEHWYPSPLVVRLITGARTLATASVAVAIAGRLTGSGGAGALIFQGMRLLDYPQMLRGFLLVVLLALVIDVLLGALQLLFFRTSRKAQPVQSAIG